MISRLRLSNLCFAALVLSSLLPASQASAEPKADPHARGVDPIIGRWQWGVTQDEFNLHQDGSATQKGRATRTGEWVCLAPNSTPRKYRINWDNGKFIDTLYLTKKGTVLSGQNQNDSKLYARRLPTQP